MAAAESDDHRQGADGWEREGRRGAGDKATARGCSVTPPTLVSGCSSRASSPATQRGSRCAPDMSAAALAVVNSSGAYQATSATQTPPSAFTARQQAAAAQSAALLVGIPHSAGSAAETVTRGPARRSEAVHRRRAEQRRGDRDTELPGSDADFDARDRVEGRRAGEAEVGGRGQCRSQSSPVEEWRHCGERTRGDRGGGRRVGGGRTGARSGVDRRVGWIRGGARVCRAQERLRRRGERGWLSECWASAIRDCRPPCDSPASELRSAPPSLPPSLPPSPPSLPLKGSARGPLRVWPSNAAQSADCGRLDVVHCAPRPPASSLSCYRFFCLRQVSPLHSPGPLVLPSSGCCFCHPPVVRSALP